MHRNPDCGTSRKRLDIIPASMADPVVIDALRKPGPVRGF